MFRKQGTIDLIQGILPAQNEPDRLFRKWNVHLGVVMRRSALMLVLICGSVTTACTQGAAVSLTPDGNYVALHVHASGDQVVAMAVGAIVQRYGYVITYEDPSVHIPRWGSTLSMQLAPAPCGITALPIDQLMSPAKMVSTLQELVALRGGHFRVEKENTSRLGFVIHVIPTDVADFGEWRGASPLDARISFPAEPRTEDKLLATIVHAISQATHLRVEFLIGSNVEIGPVIRDPHPFQFNIGANNETAREVLTRMLEANPYPVQTWSLWRSPEMWYRLYIVNVPSMFCA